MNALIHKVEFVKSYNAKMGTLHKFKVYYYDELENIKYGYYSSKNKEQQKFKPGQKAEFTLETRTTPIGDETVIKPVYQQRHSNYARKVKAEQSRYSGFAMSYAKDLVIAGKLDFELMFPAAEKMFNKMVELDKNLQ